MKRFQNGFTLLEIVVAVAILGVGVGTAMQIFSAGLKNVHRINLAQTGVGHAENVLNEILSDEMVAGPGQFSGDLDEEFAFTATVDYWIPPESQLAIDIPQMQIDLLSVVVEVYYKGDPGGRHYRAVCLKTVPRELQPGLGGAVPGIRR